ncbi:MAG TPA: hypothetical protein VM029_03320 [Opitutaceae bacterium]|nr:hypothetical protein [Opitutaceae bacterium]
MRKLVVVAAWTALCSSLAQSPTEREVYRQLSTKGDESVVALEEVLQRSENLSAVVLYSAAGVALRVARVEDAGFLFYVARIRAQFDKHLFPPTGTGGNSPMVLFGALDHQYGSAINPALMAQPKDFANALARVKSWQPRVPADYNPGWDYTAKGGEKEALAAIQAGREQFLEGMNGMATLLQDPDYFAAFKAVQDYNLKRGTERPSQESFQAAMQTMQRIEEAKGIKGIASKSKR